jgi:hypothetical protein
MTTSGDVFCQSVNWFTLYLLQLESQQNTANTFSRATHNIFDYLFLFVSPFRLGPNQHILLGETIG